MDEIMEIPNDQAQPATNNAIPNEKLLEQLNSDTLSRRKMDPWSSVIPMDLMILAQFEAIATTPKIPPFKLVTIGRNLLDFIQEAKTLAMTMKLNEKIGSGSSTANKGLTAPTPALANIPKAMEIFNSLFQRIADIEIGLEDYPIVETFYAHIWKLYLNGSMDFFISTSIISDILQKCPQYLEPLLEEALQTGDLEPLASLCLRECISGCFQSIFCMLSQIFESTNHHAGVMDFTRKLIREIELRSTAETESESYRRKLVQMYPSQFQPILLLLAEFQEINLTVDMSNVELHHQILHLTNDLYEESVSNQSLRSKQLITFFLASNPTLIDLIRDAASNAEITCTNYPYLWKVLYKL